MVNKESHRMLLKGGGSKMMKNCVAEIIYNFQRRFKLSMFSFEQFNVNSISEAGKNMK